MSFVYVSHAVSGDIRVIPWQNTGELSVDSSCVLGTGLGPIWVEPDSRLVYVAQRGDTLWVVARALKPTGDLSGTIRKLVRLNGGPSLEVGQRVSLPD